MLLRWTRGSLSATRLDFCHIQSQTLVERWKGETSARTSVASTPFWFYPPPTNHPLNLEERLTTYLASRSFVILELLIFYVTKLNWTLQMFTRGSIDPLNNKTNAHYNFSRFFWWFFHYFTLANFLMIFLTEFFDKSFWRIFLTNLFDDYFWQIFLTKFLTNFFTIFLTNFLTNFFDKFFDEFFIF